MFQLDIEQTELVKLQRRFRNLQDRFFQILAGVEPEFGAYMPYSFYQEEGHPKKGDWKKDSGPSRRHQYYPHILPAILKNAGYITRGMARELTPIMENAMNGQHLNSLRAQMRRAWENVLNAKPRTDAVNNAPEEFGFHRSTIAGYGSPRTEASIRSQQQKLMRQREFVSRFRDTSKAKSITRRLGKFRSN